MIGSVAGRKCGMCKALLRVVPANGPEFAKNVPAYVCPNCDQK